MKTGKLTLITGAMAREIIVNKEGKAKASPTLTKRRARKNASTRARLSLPQVPANPPAFC